VRHMHWRMVLKKAAIFAVLVLILLWILLPYYWMVTISLKSPRELFTYPVSLYPEEPTLRHFIKFLANGARFLINSLIASLSTVTLTMGLSIPAAYGISRYRVTSRFRKNTLLFYLEQRFLPPIAIVIPLFTLIRALQLYDSILSLILSYTLFNIPLAIWLLNGFLLEVPRDIEEASWLDGITRFRSFFTILLPMIFPQFLSTAILLFVFSWNEFIFALIFTATLKSQTLPIAAWNLVSQFEIDWQGMAAVGVITSIVPTLLFLAARRYILRGLSFGMIK
jgi:multiple sugar transport system permease protein